MSALPPKADIRQPRQLHAGFGLAGNIHSSQDEGNSQHLDFIQPLHRKQYERLWVVLVLSPPKRLFEKPLISLGYEFTIGFSFGRGSRNTLSCDLL